MAKKPLVLAAAAFLLGAGVGWLAATPSDVEQRSKVDDTIAGAPQLETDEAGGAAPHLLGRSATTTAGGADAAAQLRRLREQNDELKARLAAVEAETKERLLALPTGPDTVAVVHIRRESDASATGRLRCFVFDREGRPQSGRTLSLLHHSGKGREAKSWEFVTGADGQADLSDLEPGTYQVSLSFSHGSWQRRVDIEAGSVSEARFWVWGEKAVSIQGRVTRHGGEPARGAQIFVSRFTRGAYSLFRAKADEDGRYAVENVPPGAVDITASLALERWSVERQVEIPPGGAAEEDFVLGVPALHGVIRDEATRLPIERVRVWLVESRNRRQLEVLSDAEGRYAFRDVRHGTYTVIMRRDGYGPHRQRGLTIGAEPLQRDVTLMPAAVLVLVIKKPDGTPCVGQISLYWRAAGGTADDYEFATVHADEHGVATYRRVVPGAYQLSVSLQGAVGQRTSWRAKQTVLIEPGENRLEMTLESE